MTGVLISASAGLLFLVVLLYYGWRNNILGAPVKKSKASLAHSPDEPDERFDADDDEEGTVYLSVDRFFGGYIEDHEGITRLLHAKRIWGSENPAKRIIAMSVVAQAYSWRAINVGLLIHYEKLVVIH